MNKKALDKDYLKLFISSTLHFLTLDKKPAEVINFLKLKQIINKPFKEFYSTNNLDHLEIFDFVVKYLHSKEGATLKNEDLIKLKQELYSYFYNEYSFESYNNIVFETEIKTFIEDIFEEVNKIKDYSQLELLKNIEIEAEYLRSLYFIKNLKEKEDLLFTNNADNIVRIKQQIQALYNLYNSFEVKNDDSIILDSEAMIEDYLNLQEELENEKRIINLFREFDIIESRRLLICIAPTGFGKSQFLCHTASDYLMNAPNPDNGIDKYNIIFYFSFENTKNETLLRILANITDYRINDIKEMFKKGTKEDIRKLLSIFKQRVPNYNKLEIIEMAASFGGVNIRTIEERIKKTLKKYPNSRVYAIIIDYLDLMHSITKRGGQKWEELGEISKEMKSLAMSFKAPVITATQTNREGEEKVAKKQEFSKTEVAEGYSKLKDADVILGLVVKAIDISSPEYEYIDRHGKIIIMKHRYGSDNVMIPITADYRRAKFFRLDQMSEAENVNTYILKDTSNKKDNNINTYEFSLKDENNFDPLFDEDFEVLDNTKNLI